MIYDQFPFSYGVVTDNRGFQDTNTSLNIGTNQQEMTSNNVSTLTLLISGLNASSGELNGVFLMEYMSRFVSVGDALRRERPMTPTLVGG